jgi:hypothetical protein
VPPLLLRRKPVRAPGSGDGEGRHLPRIVRIVTRAASHFVTGSAPSPLAVGLPRQAPVGF